MVYKSSLRQGGSGGTGNFDNVNVGDGTKPALLKITPAQNTFTFENIQGSIDAWRIVQDSGYLYVAGYTQNALTVYSLANPAAPLQVGQHDFGAAGTAGGVDARGNYAYTVDSVGGVFSTFDVSAHGNPFLLNTHGLPAASQSILISSDPNYLYVGNGTRLYVYDVSTHVSPTLVHNIGRGAEAMEVVGNYLYTASADTGKISVFDTTTPSNPTFITDYSVTFNTSDVAWLAANSTALAVGNDASDTKIYSVSGSALTAASVIATTSYNTQNLYITGDTLIIPDYNDNLVKFYSLANPAAPRFLGSVSSSQPSDTVVAGNYLYVTNEVGSSLSTFYFGLSSQTTPDFEIYDTNGNLVDWVDPDGQFNFAQGAAKITATGDVTAVSFTGDGSGLTGVHGTPGGTDGQIQWNNAGVLAGADLITDGGADIGASSGLWQILADGTILTGFGNFIVNPDGTISVANGQLTVDSGGNIVQNSSYIFGTAAINPSGGQNFQINVDGSISFDAGAITSNGTGILTAAQFIGQYQNLAGSAYINPDGSAVFAGNNVVIDNSGNITAISFITSGGSSGQFVKGDGSLDGNTYASLPVAISDLGDGSSNISQWNNDVPYLTSGDLTGYVPYTGAVSAVDLGPNSIYLQSDTISIGDTVGSMAWINGSGDSSFSGGELTITAGIISTGFGDITIGSSAGTFAWIDFGGNAHFAGAFSDSTNSTGSTGYVLSSTTSGTQWIDPSTFTSGFVPYTGATGNVDLGANSIYLQSDTISIGDASAVNYISTDGSTSFANGAIVMDTNGNLALLNTYPTYNASITIGGPTDISDPFGGLLHINQNDPAFNRFLIRAQSNSDVESRLCSLFNFSGQAGAYFDLVGGAGTVEWLAGVSPVAEGANFIFGNATGLGTSANAQLVLFTSSLNTAIGPSSQVEDGTGAQLQVFGTGGLSVHGPYIDSVSSPGTSGYVLSSTVTGTEWVPASGGGGSSTGPMDAIQTSDGSGGFLGTGNATVDSSGNFVGAKYQLTSGAYFEDFGSFTILVIGDLIGGGAFWQIDGSGSAGFAGNVTAAAFVTSGGSSSDVVLGDGTLGTYNPGGTPASPSGSLQYNNSGSFGGVATASLNSSGQITLTGLPGSLIGQLNIVANGVTGSLKGQSSINFENINTTKGYFIGHDVAGSGNHNFFWYDRTLNQNPIFLDGDTGGTNTVYLGSAAPSGIGLATPGNVIVGGTSDSGSKFQVVGSTSLGNGTMTVDASGNTTAASYIGSNLTASKPVFTDGSKKLVSTGTVPVANGGTGQTTPVVVAASFSGTGTATTVFTVTIGTTQANNTYKVAIEPTNLLSAALQYVTNKTTTTFDVTYLAGLTGGVAFDWSLFT